MAKTKTKTLAMLRTSGFLLVAAATIPAAAADAPMLVGGGDNAEIVRPVTATGNVAGGGRMTVQNGISGSFVVTYHDAMPATGAGIPTLAGGGDSATLVYGPSAPAGSRVLASRR